MSIIDYLCEFPTPDVPLGRHGTAEPDPVLEGLRGLPIVHGAGCGAGDPGLEGCNKRRLTSMERIKQIAAVVTTYSVL